MDVWPASRIISPQRASKLDSDAAGGVICIWCDCVEVPFFVVIVVPFQRGKQTPYLTHHRGLCYAFSVQMKSG